MLTSRPRDKKCGDEEKKGRHKDFQWRALELFRPWPSPSITVIQINSLAINMIMKVVTIAKILIATCFGPIPPAAAALVSAWLPISFHNSELSLPPNPRKPAQATHGCTFIWLQLHLKAHKFWCTNLDLAMFIPELLAEFNLGLFTCRYTESQQACRAWSSN